MCPRRPVFLPPYRCLLNSCATTSYNREPRSRQSDSTPLVHKIGGVRQFRYHRSASVGAVLRPHNGPTPGALRVASWLFSSRFQYSSVVFSRSRWSSKCDLVLPLGKNKDLAEYFWKMWARYVGPVGLVYTRTPEGRRFLLKARTHSMSRRFQSRAERLKSWQ